MAGPWEKYGSAPEVKASADGPWTKYATAAPAPVAAAPQAPAEPPARSDPSLLMAPVGALELGLEGVTGALASIPASIAYGGAALARAAGADVDPASVQSRVRSALTYEPVSESAQAGEQALSNLVQTVAEPVMSAADAVASAVGRVNPTAETFLREAPAALEAATGVLPVAAAGRAALNAARAPKIVEGAANVRGGDAIERGRALGYKFRPSDVRAARPGEKTPGLLREGLEQPNDLRRDTTIENQAITTRHAAEEIGAQNTKALTDADFERLRAEPLKVYESAGNAAGRFRTTPDYHNELNGIIGKPGLEPSVRRKIRAQVEQYRLDQMSGPDALKTISALRRRATKQLRSEDVLQNDLGAANRAIADALETELGRQLAARGETELLEQFREARTRLAKIHDVESATKGGQVDAHALARLARRGVPLTGRLRIIADVAEAAPNVLRHSSRATGVGNSVKAETLTGAAKDVVKGAINKLPGMNVMSERFQSKNFGRQATPTELSYLPDAGRRQSIAPVAPRAPQYESVPFTETPGVVPARAITLSRDLGLEPDPVPNATQLPPAPDMLTADVPPATPSGGLRFTPSTPIAAQLADELGLAEPPDFGGIPFRPPSLAEQMAGDLELGRPTRPGELTLAPHSVVPTQVDMPLSQALLPDVLELVPPAGNAPARIPPTTLADQLGLGLGEPLKLERPPGKIGKPKSAGKPKK